MLSTFETSSPCSVFRESVSIVLPSVYAVPIQSALFLHFGWNPPKMRLPSKLPKNHSVEKSTVWVFGTYSKNHFSTVRIAVLSLVRFCQFVKRKVFAVRSKPRAEKHFFSDGLTKADRKS
jgi:hypothetical protein